LDSELPSFVVHDLRRTVRTRLSELRVPEHIAEAVIGHSKRGLARVYNQHRYATEIREALELWNARLRAIVEPPPANVVALRGKGA
jgi:integrase